MVGTNRRVDLVLPLHAPIGEYIGLLVELCGQRQTETLPEVWSLAPLGRRPLPLDAKLIDCDPVEGLVLYLRDLGADEAYEPVATDVDEIVEENADGLARWRWNQRTVASTIFGGGAAWLAGMVAALVAAPHRPPGAAAFCALVGLLVPAVAAAAARGRWPVPEWVLVSSALVAPGCLAAAAWLATGTVGAAFAFACFGGLVAAGAVPDRATLAVALWLSAAAAAAVPLTIFHTTAMRVMTVLAFGGFVMHVIGPAVAGRLALARLSGRGSDAALDTAVPRAHRTLCWWSSAAGAAMAVGLVALARSADLYAGILVVALAMALVFRSATYKLAVEAVAANGAAVAGLATLSVSADGGAAVAGPLVGAGVGVVLLATGCWLVRRRSPLAVRLPRQLSALAMFLVAIAVLAATAEWGLLHWLLDLGASLN